MSHPTTTYHLVPREYWLAADPADDYTPEPFAREGFIHTTHDPVELAATANRYYRHDPRPYLVLEIALSRVRAPIRIEDPGGRYPHIHGPLNRDAIVAVREAPRNADGSFPAPLPGAVPTTPGTPARSAGGCSHGPRDPTPHRR